MADAVSGETARLGQVVGGSSVSRAIAAMPRPRRDVGSRFSTDGRTDLALPIGIESHRLVVFSGVTLNHPYRTFCGRLGGW
jgi:hypothetical protein